MSFGQSRIESLVEACVGTVIGFAVSFAAWPIVGWILDLPYTSSQHFYITLLFTIISVLRSYIVRRYFNKRLKKLTHDIASRING